MPFIPSHAHTQHFSARTKLFSGAGGGPTQNMPTRAALGLAPVGSSPSSPSRFGNGMSTSSVSGVIDGGGGGGEGAGGEGSSIAGILRGAGGGGAANAANNIDDFSERLRRRLSLSDVSSSYETINAILGRPPEANNNGDDGSQGAGGVAHFSNFLGAGAPMTSSSPPTSRQGQYDAEMKRNGMQGLIRSDAGGGEMMAVPASRGPTGAGAPVGGMARSGNVSGSSGELGGATTVTAALSDEYEQLKKMFEEVSGHSILDPPPGDDAFPRPLLGERLVFEVHVASRTERLWLVCLRAA